MTLMQQQMTQMQQQMHETNIRETKASDMQAEKMSFRVHMYALENFFYGLVNGTFLEIGALDGVRYSNTSALERDMS